MIEVKNLTKFCEDQKVIDNIRFSIQNGMACGF